MLVPKDHFGNPFGDQVLPLVLPGVPWNAPRDSREPSGRSLGTPGIFKNLCFPLGKQRFSTNPRFRKNSIFTLILASQSLPKSFQNCSEIENKNAFKNKNKSQLARPQLKLQPPNEPGACPNAVDPASQVQEASKKSSIYLSI